MKLGCKIPRRMWRRRIPNGVFRIRHAGGSRNTENGITNTDHTDVCRSPPTARHSLLAFTLIEILVVVGIIGVIMTIAIPSIYQTLHQDSMRKAVSDVMEACSHARAQAILNGVNMALRIHPRDREFQVVTLSGGTKKEAGDPEPDEGHASGSAVFSVRLSNRIMIEMVDVNFIEYKDEDEALVHFYPNGTSDEFTMVLLNDQNEARKISLEVVTALADVEVDPTKWR